MQLGQLYTLELRAKVSKTGERIRALYIVSADSVEGVKAKIPFMLDMTKFAEFSIKAVTRVKPGFHVVFCHTTEAPEAPSFVEPDGVTTHHVRTNQPTSANQFAIGIAGSITAESSEHALRKLGRHLQSLGTEAQTGSPLHNGVIHVEEIGSGSLETMSRDVSHWKAAQEVRVGSVG